MGYPRTGGNYRQQRFYVKNCIAYRDKLSNTHIAQTFLDIFRNEKS